MDIVKGARELFKLRKKELGYPVSNWSFINGMWVMANDNAETYIRKGYKSLPYIYSIISQIIDKASDAPGQIMVEKNRRKAQGYLTLMKGAKTGADIVRGELLRKQAFDQVEGHPFLNVLDKPNPLQSQKELVEEYLGYLLITGNAFMYAGVPGEASINASKPQELWVVPSPSVTILAGDRLEPVRGYKVSYFDGQEIPEWQMLHTKYFNPQSSYDNIQDMLWGLAPLKAYRSTMSQASAADVAQGTLFKNMGPAGIISGNDNPDSLTETQSTAIQDSFNNKHMGIYQAGGIVVTPAKVSWQQIGVSPVDLNILEADANFLQKLAAIFRFPHELITGSQNVASQGMADKQLVTKAVMPLLRRFDDGMTKWARALYNDDRLFYVSDTSYFTELSENRKEQSEYLSKSWWFTGNERRIEMGFDTLPDENMNKILVPSGFRTIEDVAEPLEIDTDILNDNNANDYNREEGNQ